MYDQKKKKKKNCVKLVAIMEDKATTKKIFFFFFKLHDTFNFLCFGLVFSLLLQTSHILLHVRHSRLGRATTWF